MAGCGRGGLSYGPVCPWGAALCSPFHRPPRGGSFVISGQVEGYEDFAVLLHFSYKSFKAIQAILESKGKYIFCRSHFSFSFPFAFSKPLFEKVTRKKGAPLAGRLRAPESPSGLTKVFLLPTGRAVSAGHRQNPEPAGEPDG